MHRLMSSAQGGVIFRMLQREAIYFPNAALLAQHRRFQFSSSSSTATYRLYSTGDRAPSKLINRAFLSTTNSVLTSKSQSSEGSRDCPADSHVTGYRNRKFFFKFVLGTALLVTVIRFSDDGNRRGATFWVTTFPAFLHYKATENIYRNSYVKEAMNRTDSTMRQILPPEDQAFQALHDFYSPRIEQLCLSLRGMYLKNAQFLSLRDDIVPETYLKWCRQLQSMAPTRMDGETARKIMEQELVSGEKGIESLDDVFEWIDFDKPIGSAAIGVVYKARLKGHDGKIVAVKVQLPGTERQFRADLETMRFFCSFAYPSIITSFDELERQFLSEFDYQLEAQNLRNVYDNWKASGTNSTATGRNYDFGNRVKVPEPVEKLCTKLVLVMEFLEGKSFVRGLEELMQDMSRRAGKPVEEMERELKRRIKEGKLDSLQSLKLKLRMAERWEGVKRFWDVVGGWLSFGWTGFGLRWCVVKGTDRPEAKDGNNQDGSSKAGSTSTNLFDVASFVEVLLHFWCHQCIIDGLVQTDPHPGNYLILKDGRMGCIDFGQQKQVPYELRMHFARTIVYLHRAKRIDELNERIDGKDPKLKRILDSECIPETDDYNSLISEIFPTSHHEMTARLRKFHASDIDINNCDPELYQLLVAPIGKDRERNAAVSQPDDPAALRLRLIKSYIDEKLNDICVHRLNCRSRYGDGELRLEILRMWMMEDHPKIKLGTANLDSLVHEWESRDPGHSIDADIVTVNRAAFMIRSLCRELGLSIVLTDVWHLYALDFLERERIDLETGERIG